jgi:hypothetical protein
MGKCKVFIERLDNLEDEVNIWLKANPNVVITHTNIGSHDDYIILYKELKEIRKEKLINLEI